MGAPQGLLRWVDRAVQIPSAERVATPGPSRYIPGSRPPLTPIGIGE